MDGSRRDPHPLIAAAGRGLARAPARFADRFVRLVDETPDARLERVMRSPARRAILEGVFWQMPHQLDRGRAAGMNAAVLWRIAGRRDGGTDDFRLLIADGRARTVRGSSGEPPILTITIDAVDFLKLTTGTLDPMRAYFGGKMALGGDIMFAARVGGLFKVPTPRTRAPTARGPQPR
jgi:hypothetical protein